MVHIEGEAWWRRTPCSHTVPGQAASAERMYAAPPSRCRCAAAGSEDRGITHAHDHPLARAAACHAVESTRRRSSQQPNQFQDTAGVVITPACKGILMDQVTCALTRRRCLTSLTLRCRSTAPCHGLEWAPGNPYPCPIQNHQCIAGGETAIPRGDVHPLVRKT